MPAVDMNAGIFSRVMQPNSCPSISLFPGRIDQRWISHK